jgi:hypothetical protein
MVASRTRRNEDMTTRKEPRNHRVIATNANGRTIWKSAPGSKVAFYASAANSPQGALELSIAAVEAFKLKGEDRVIVLEVNADGTPSVSDIVHVSSPDFWRSFMAQHGIGVAA